MMHNDVNDDKDDEEGSGGSGSGAPALRPTEEQLLALQFGDPNINISEIEHFGAWALHLESLKVINVEFKKHLSLDQLDTPSKILKVIIGLTTQTQVVGQSWQIDNLLQAIDKAAQAKFKKTLYTLTNHTQDSAKFDWKNGRIKPLHLKMKP